MNPVVCIEVVLRQMEHVVVVEKIPGSRLDPNPGRGVGESPKSHDTNEITWRE